MNPASEAQHFDGPAGRIEVLIDRPQRARAGGGWAIVAHPHPLYGGSMHNKVAQTLARAHVAEGWVALRFNFRGVGASAGVHDQGVGESVDLLALRHHFAAGQPWALAGFSFGAYVALRALAQIESEAEAGGPAADRPQSLLLVGAAASRFALPPVPEPLHACTALIHGEVDDTVPLPAVLDWARPQGLALTLLPGVDHFFHGHLTPLKALVQRHLRVCASAEWPLSLNTSTP